MNEYEIKKMSKTSKTPLIIGIILLVLSLLLFFTYASFIYRDDDITPQSYYDLAIEGKDTSGQYVYIDLNEAYQFAVETTDDGTEYEYFYAFDDNDGLYIVCMTEDKFDEIAVLYNANPDNFTYKLTGYLYNTDNDIKELACETLQEVFELDYSVSADEYDDYFLSTYLDASRTPVNYIDDLAIILITICLFGGIGFLIGFVVKTIKNKKMYSSSDVKIALAELQQGVYDKKNNIIMTNNYLISNRKKFACINYKDIVWVYSHPINYSGRVFYELIVNGINKTDSYGMFSIAEELNSVVTKLQEVNPKIMVGYSKENVEKFNEYKAEMNKK
ncbi:MAG: hypothetical protein Q4C64_03820 [Erysipelotrichia bacterium]|nr:hypothetical protein [Erysipelotrichia bacterium]